MAASSSSTRRHCTEDLQMPTPKRLKTKSYQLHEHTPNTSPCTHDIFLSHTGKQKGFVKGIYEMLCSSYTTFFDITHHSLPPSEPFPPHIFKAAKNCRLAVVVLSNDFVIKKWPMLELCAFIDASVKILPLFYKLSPSDLKCPIKLEEWRKVWDDYALHEPKRIKPLEWERALRKLSSLGGLPFDEHEGELAYLKEITKTISETIPLAIHYEESGIHGMKRLCEVILAEFELLESSYTHDLPLKPSVCVLGMYGLQGSGKSTTSKCLCNHYSLSFHGNALYYELPTNPTTNQLVEICKCLCTRLTNFRNMVDLTHATTLEEMYHTLRSYSLQGSKVFLVLDNIHEKTLEFVQRILCHVVGAGSKVLLVARTHVVLHSLLRNLPYVCKAISVPSVNEEEALRILLQSVDVNILQDSRAIENALPIRRRLILEEVVRISSFGTTYLPLMLKMMGDRLRSFELDVDMWADDMERYWKYSKETVLSELVHDSFMNLSVQLRVLFLDLALFIIPSAIYKKSEAWEFLSVMHECSPTEIKFHMYTLQKQCFLKDVYCTYNSIHDVFGEFAASVPESSMYYRHGERNNADRLPREPPPPPDEKARQFGLRAVVLEQLNEGQERFSFWPGFPNVKALVLRNCTKLAVLNLMGLTSLTSLDIHNCPCLVSAELSEGLDLQSIRRLIWVNKQGMRKNMVLQQQWSNEQEKQLLCSSRVPRDTPTKIRIGGFASQMRNLQVLMLYNTGITHLRDMSGCWPHLTRLEVMEETLEYMEVGYLPYLKTFLLNGDGRDDQPIFTRIEASHSPRLLMGKNLLAGCPKLEEVEVCSVSFNDDGGLGALATSQLRKIWLGDFWHGEKLPDLSASAQSLKQLWTKKCGVLKIVDFMQRFQCLTEVKLTSCLSLVEVSGLDRLPSLDSLSIHECINLQTLNGLSGLSSLQYMSIGHCQSLQTLNGLSGLSSLQEMLISHCQSLQTLSGLSGLSSLQEMSICHCQSLQTLSSLRGLVSLQEMFIENCTSLQTLGGLSGLVSLDVFCVGLGCPNLEVLLSDFSNLKRLKCLRYNKYNTYAGTLFNVRNLRSLEILELCCSSHNDEVMISQKKCPSFCDLARLLLAGDLRMRAGVLSSLSRLSSLCYLSLTGLENLASLNGIRFLRPLRELALRQVPNLSCLQGIECLTNLTSLTVKCCASVEELPSLSRLVNMCILHFEDCEKLMSVEGCSTMEGLQCAKFIRCQSLACFPLDDISACELYCELQIKGSKFASIEQLLLWLVDEECNRSPHVCAASLEALEWELCNNLGEKQRELGVRLVKTLGVELIKRVNSDDDQSYCSYFGKMASALDKVWCCWNDGKRPRPATYPDAAVKLLRELASVPKGTLIEQCQFDADSIESMVRKCLAEIDHPFLLQFFRKCTLEVFQNWPLEYSSEDSSEEEERFQAGSNFEYSSEDSSDGEQYSDFESWLVHGFGLPHSWLQTDFTKFARYITKNLAVESRESNLTCH